MGFVLVAIAIVESEEIVVDRLKKERIYELSATTKRSSHCRWPIVEVQLQLSHEWSDGTRPSTREI